jgi:short-subunit dehydrogenase
MLRQNSEGHIVNVASVAGLLSLPYVAIYHATKHAVVTITESLHYELALQNAKLKTSVLCPGWVGTRIIDCYRNRPAEMGETNWQGPAVVASVGEAYRQFCEAGFPADYVADQVFHGIWHENLYILTTNEFNELVTQRAGNIVAQRSPVLDANLVQALGLAQQAVEAVAPV